jgi:hypothetical protein
MTDACSSQSGLKQNTVEPGCNNIGLFDTSAIASDILWYQLISHS